VVAPLGLKANAIERVAGRWVGAADPRSEGTAIDINGRTAAIRRVGDKPNRPAE
jgi:gamma-glutamyltranspeptidase/glutathione hydrolase